MPTILRDRLAYERDRIGFLRACQQQHGDVFRFSDSTVVVLDPELIHTLFCRTNSEFGIEGPLLAGTQARPDTAATMAVRRRCLRALSAEAADRYESRMAGILRQTLAETNGRSVDVLRVMKTYSARTVVEHCLGPSGTDLVDVIADAVVASEAFMSSSLSLPAWLPIPRVRRLRRTSGRLRRMVTDQIAARRERPRRDGPADLLDVLLADEDLKADAVTAVFEATLRASYGQSGATLAWAVRILAVRPETRRQVAVSAEYAEAFVKELLRCFPPTWLMGRDVWEPATVGDLVVRPGEQVMFCTYLVHRDDRWWHDPATFAPERWLAAAPPHAPHAYFPFGVGPRFCLGKHIALRQLVVAVQTLVREYDSTVDNQSAPMLPGALLVPNGLRARFVPHQS